MFKIYKKRPNDYGNEIFDKKTTANPLTASRIFWEYRQDRSLEGQTVALVVTQDSKELVYHKFNLASGYNNHIGLDDTLPSPLLPRAQAIDPHNNADRQNKKRVEAKFEGEEIQQYDRLLSKFGEGKQKYGARQLFVELMTLYDNKEI
ncbi:hypothetical protein [Pseudoalteromonas sp. M8]|uniref:hypothetical protein n=1 Tax=Pseudoalteromonas sp. M8 TaxID=2692624 RepID=UPI001BA4B4CF|nr:hypothetical protein [Pseudoalteromonas sp. M8]QUI71279.1 hypothetical protein GSF13_16655 [Pseudoalteromonas sp. M8]